jgi:hypothetical protein
MNAKAKQITETISGLFKTRQVEYFVVDMDGVESRHYSTMDQAEAAADRINESCKALGYSNSRDWFAAMNADPMKGVDDL